MNKISEQAIAQREKSTTTDLALIKRTVAPGATDDQLAMFLHDCERRGVHPLDRLLVFTNAGGKYTPITTIDFMRSRAAASNEIAGSDDAVFKNEPGGKPISASVTVYRLTDGMKYPYSATARLQEYYKNTPTWNKMPHTMLAKCAEALALRKAFPAQLHGLYTREEMDQASAENEIEIIAEDVDQAALKLASAAETGVLGLQEAWQELSQDEKRKFKSALDQRYKPRAIEVDNFRAGVPDPLSARGEGGEQDQQPAAEDLSPHNTTDQPAAGQADPAAADELESDAFERGQADRARGARRSAVPGEYRNNSKLAIAWVRGWETAK